MKRHPKKVSLLKMLLKRKNEIMVGNLGILIIIDNSFDNAPIVYF